MNHRRCSLGALAGSLLLLALAAGAQSCAGSTQDPAPASPAGQSPTPAAEAQAAATDPKALAEAHKAYALHRGSECQAPLATEAREKLYQFGVQRLAEGKDGEHYLVEPYTEALAALAIAAEAGELRAQTLYGTRGFGDRFTNEAPKASEREGYTLALKYLVIAIRRGDPGAKQYFGAAGGALEQDPVPASLEVPLSEVPRAWLDDAVVAAKQWLACSAPSR